MKTIKFIIPTIIAILIVAIIAYFVRDKIPVPKFLTKTEIVTKYIAGKTDTVIKRITERFYIKANNANKPVGGTETAQPIQTPIQIDTTVITDGGGLIWVHSESIADSLIIKTDIPKFEIKRVDTIKIKQVDSVFVPVTADKWYNNPFITYPLGAATGIIIYFIKKE